MSSLELVLFYLLAAVVGVVVFRSLRLPSMLGYLAVGALIGPHMLAMVQRSARIAHLAEFGVVFLMFVIGLEFSLPKLRTMKRHVLGLGAMQVGLTMLLGTMIFLGLRNFMPSVWRVSWQGAVALAAVLAMSSTAIVVKMMAERLELDTEYGKRVLGVLLFQDLAVVPLLILFPALSASDDDLGLELLLALVKAGVLVGLLLTVGQRMMKQWMDVVAKRRNDELFMLNVLLLTLGLAWLTEQAGLSLALGAFLAGMLVAETPYKYQVEADIRPFHDLLLGLFFITVGMMLDWHELVWHWQWMLIMLSLPVLFKLAVVWGSAWLLGGSNGDALRAGLYLAGAGEFGFVLLNLALKGKLVPSPLFNAILAGMVLSMIATPFIIMSSQRIVLRFARSEWEQEALKMTDIVRKSLGRSGHVIICGYGRSGQSVARMLDLEKVPYIALDSDPDLVRQASAAGAEVVYGDGARPQVLQAAGLARARAVVITVLDMQRTLRVLHQLRKLAPHVPVVVRTQDDRHLESLRAAGATEVVPEAVEGSLVLAGHAMALLGVPMRTVRRRMQRQRADRYRLLRGYFHSADDPGGNGADNYLSTLTLEQHAQVIGQSVAQLQASLDGYAVRLLGLRRANGSSQQLHDALPIQAGDTLVLAGSQRDLAEAEDLLSH